LEAKCDKKVLEELEESRTGHSQELWRKMAELGWMGVIIPEEYDGVGLSMMELAIIMEEFGRAALSSPFFGTVMGSLAIIKGGKEELKKSILPKIVEGGLILSMAVEEPEVNYDMSRISLQAREDDTQEGDKGYTINGTKLFVQYPTVADYLIVAARTKGVPGEKDGITFFLVDAKATGISYTSMKTIAADKQFQVDFENVAVSSENIIGKPHEALPILESIRNETTPILCAEMVGGALKELDMTAEYTRERQQFDRPIGSFQAVQHRLADMYIDAHGARLATYQAVWRVSCGKPSERETSIAKYFTSKACREVAFSAQQLHGGMGVDLDYDLHFYYRRAKAMELKLGPETYHLRALGSDL
jgi:alkylation response protein AidB-like acyl-CoA dehydrogenase